VLSRNYNWGTEMIAGTGACDSFLARRTAGIFCALNRLRKGGWKHRHVAQHQGGMGMFNTSFRAVICSACVAGLSGSAVAADWDVVRELPDAYVPGRVMTVTIRSEDNFSYIEEMIPSGWSFLGSPGGFATFDEDTSMMIWSLPPDLPHTAEYPYPGCITYKVRPPLDQRGEVSFTGYSGGGYFLGFPIGGDSVISDREGVTRSLR